MPPSAVSGLKEHGSRAMRVRTSASGVRELQPSGPLRRVYASNRPGPISPILSALLSPHSAGTSGAREGALNSASVMALLPAGLASAAAGGARRLAWRRLEGKPGPLGLDRRVRRLGLPRAPGRSALRPPAPCWIDGPAVRGPGACPGPGAAVTGPAALAGFRMGPAGGRRKTRLGAQGSCRRQPPRRRALGAPGAAGWKRGDPSLSPGWARCFVRAGPAAKLRRSGRVAPWLLDLT